MAAVMLRSQTFGGNHVAVAIAQLSPLISYLLHTFHET